MKYAKLPVKIPQSKRAEYNERCLRVIDEGLTTLSKEDVANFYTGIGGLYGLCASDYESYAKYSDAKKEFEGGQFFTDYALAQWVTDCIRPDESDLIADLTCGHGSFFNCLPNEENLIGIELEERAARVAVYLYPDANIRQGDILQWVPKDVDIVVGNPPFGLRWELDGEDQKLVPVVLYMPFRLFRDQAVRIINKADGRQLSYPAPGNLQAKRPCTLFLYAASSIAGWHSG